MKKRALRYDYGTIEPIDQGEGFLRARVTIARDGVFPYLTPSGEIRMEAKLPQDIFSEVTIDTAKGAPICDGHPPVNDNRGLISPQNFNKYVKGALGDSITVVDGHLTGIETIYDAALIEDLKAGKKREVSIGFDTELDFTPGQYQGERYDARQTHIQINHLAHVDKGRAGESVRAHLDGAIGAGLDIAVMKADHRDRTNTSKETRRDAMDENAILAALKKFFAWVVKGGADEEDGDGDAKNTDGGAPDTQPPADGSGEDPKGKADSGAEIKRLQAKIDALEALLKKKDSRDSARRDAAEIDKRIAARMTLVDAARSLIPDFKHDGLSDRDIKLAVIGKSLPFEGSVKTDELEDVFVDARYDAALSLAREKAAIGDGDSGASSRLDEAAIEKKRASRLDVMNMK